MKKLVLLSSLLTIVLFACKKDKAVVTTPNNNSNIPNWETGNVTSDMMVFLNSKAPVFNTYSVNSATTAMFTNDSIAITVPANTFVKADGSDYTGTINFKMQTIRTIKDMLYSGVTTLAGNGTLLVSDGMFRLEAYDPSNNKLQIKPGRTIIVTFPRWNDNNLVFKGSEMVGKSNKVAWNEWDSMDLKRNNTVTLVIGLDSIFKYTNLDRFMQGTPTDITVTVPPGFTNKNTECFMKYVGENASGYIPSKPAIKAFSTVDNSYKVIQGKAAKVICFSKKDGKFYYQIKTISSMAVNQTLAMDNMVETTESGLEAIVAAF